MASQLRVDEIIASTGSSVAIGTAGGSVTLAGDFTVDTSKGLNVGTGATIFSPSSNVLTLGTNNAERVRIDSSGNFGIGTNNPTAHLHLNSSGATQILVNTTSSSSEPQIILQDTAASDYFAIQKDGRDLRFKPQGSEALRITSSGRIGIGTDNPDHRLTLDDGNGSASGGILIKNAVYSSNIDRPYLIAGTSKYDGTTSDWGTFGFQHRIKSNSGGTSRVTIDTVNGEVFCVNNSGNVGIGTDNPAGNLEVYNGAGLSSLVIQTPAGSDAELEFRNTNGGNATWSIGLDYDDSKKFKIAYASANGASLSANELIAISTGGNIELASGAGIDFSATGNGSGSMTSELLDDYEEGTWTPDLRFGGSNTGVSYAWRNGHYTKIGRQVTVRCAFGLSSKGTFTATARAAIYGLPFDIAPYDITGGFNYSFVGSYNGGVSGIHVIEHQYSSSTPDRFQLSRITAVDTDFSEMQYQHVGGTQRIAFVTTYFAAS